MSEHFSQAKQLLEQSQNILLTTHERTDGDDLGSVLALSHFLKKSGKRTTIVITGGTPTQLNFLPDSDLVFEELPKNIDYDLLVTSGCSVLNRVNNPEIESLNIPILNFDHHPDNELFGQVNVVQASKSSVAELVYDFFTWCNWEISHQVAICLLTGIITDTGMLMHSNVQSSTLSVAAELMKKGASISQTAKHTFTAQSEIELKVWGKALENSYFNPKNQMIYAVLTKDDLSELGNPDLSSIHGLVETLNKVPKAKFAMLLKEDGDRIKGSLRSEKYKGVDVQAVAQSLGGGGHKLAAGFSVIGKLIKKPTGQWEVVSTQN